MTDTNTVNALELEEAGTVAFDNGESFKYPAKGKLKKTVEINEEGTEATVSFYLKNGNHQHVTINADTKLLIALAAHGMSQKVGDSISSSDDLEDAQQSVERVIAQLAEGTFNMRRQSSGSTGNLNMLTMAIMRVKDWDEATAKEAIGNMSDAAVTQVKAVPAVASALEDIKAERAEERKAKQLAKLEKEAEESGTSLDDILGAGDAED